MERGEYDRVKKITHTSMGLIALVMVMGMAISCAIPQQLMGLFTTSRATMEIGGAALRIISFGFVVSSVSVTFSGVLEGLGKEHAITFDFSCALYRCDAAGFFCAQPVVTGIGRVVWICRYRVYRSGSFLLYIQIPYERYKRVTK